VDLFEDVDITFPLSP